MKKFKICFFCHPSCHARVDCQICSCAENAYNKYLSDMELKLNLAQYCRMCCVLRSSLKVDQIWRTCFTCSGYWIHSGSKNSCPNLITTLLYFKVSVVDIGVRIKHTSQCCTRVLLSVDRLAWLSNRYLHIILCASAKNWDYQFLFYPDRPWISLKWSMHEIIHIWTAVVDESEEWSSQ